MPVSSDGAAECAAIDTELAIVVRAWAMLNQHSRSIIVGMSRKAMALGPH
jgi:hypothetical protein